MSDGVGDVVRPTHVEVELDAISDNVAAIDAHVGSADVMPVVKANAYGHGLVPVAKHLVASGTRRLAVAYVEEGIELRRAGIEVPILIMGGSAADQVPLFVEHRLTPGVASVSKLALFQAAASSAGRILDIHLNIDTGMERLGIHWHSAEPLLDAALRSSSVRVEGVYTHFANSDAADLTHARTQVERFHEATSFYDRRSAPMPLRHLCNSGGVLQLPEAHLELVRPGVMIYGVMPSDEAARTVEIRPAMRWVSTAVYVKLVEAGSPVSYGSTWAPERRTRIVTVPAGYGDGWFRAHSNRAEVLIGGRRRPIVGRVCMDQFMVDVDDDEVSPGDEVVLMGAQGGERITAEELGAHVGTIGYEICTNVAARVPRVYV
ncbi:MAG: alanine racemase [Actinomycetota bacterium]